MARQILLLRGINVGGKNKLPMADLRAMCAAAGWSEVATYIQSGNVVLDAPTEAGATAAQLSAIVGEALGTEIRVLGRSQLEVEGVLDGLDPSLADADPSRVVVVFRADPARDVESATLASSIERLAGIADRCWIESGHVVMAVPHGQSKSPLADLVARSPIGRHGTARNLRTVAKLAELASR